MTAEAPEKKFVHVSYRIPMEARVALAREAKRLGINENALVNRVFAKFVFFDRIADFLEAVPLNKRLFNGMLGTIEASEMASLGRELGSSRIKRMFSFLNIDFDVDNLITYFFQPLSTYSKWYDFNIVRTGTSAKLMFEHPYGAKWSAFLGQYLAAIIRSATGTEPRTTADEELVTIVL